MKLNSLELMSRISRIRDEQAGERVTHQRNAVEQIRQQARMLSNYRDKLSLSLSGSGVQKAQFLQARGAFIKVAETAAEEVHQQLANSEAELKRALSHWVDTHERDRVLHDKYRKARRLSERDREKRVEKDLPASQSTGKG